jgi:hypothetical protein
MWKTPLVIAKDLIWSTSVEQRQRSAVPADFHHVFDKTLDRLLFSLFPLKTFAKRINHRSGQRFTGAPGERSR